MADAEQVAEVLAWLERKGTKRNVEGMARYGIVAKKVFGVSVGELRTYAKGLGRSHALALRLWETEWYEARMLAGFVDVPAEVTPAQMDAWARDFDNWAVCDSTCFHLFDRTPHAWTKVERWAPKRDEFVRRAAFALIASLSVHDKRAPDAPYLRALELVERYAIDDRNFVKKAVNWALRSVGKRNVTLNGAAVEVARGLAHSEEATPRWVGRDALRELTSEALQTRLMSKAAKAAKASKATKAR